MKHSAKLKVFDEALREAEGVDEALGVDETFPGESRLLEGWRASIFGDEGVGTESVKS